MPRAKAFDPSVALDRAVELFWQKGYEGASMTMLLQAMEISRQSLYDTFGDKHKLYLAALDRYHTNLHVELKRLMDTHESGRAAIRAVFDMVGREVLDRPEHRSCMMANAALELGQHDDAVRGRVAGHLAQVEDLFHAALERDRAVGEIAAGRDTQAAARCLVNAIHGLGVLGRAGVMRSTIDATIAATLATYA
jgi:TetR/AcrR family transcriptional regulator, transcriptional repressor for nem operon